jgi:hypothetical protein
MDQVCTLTLISGLPVIDRLTREIGVNRVRRRVGTKEKEEREGQNEERKRVDQSIDLSAHNLNLAIKDKEY